MKDIHSLASALMELDDKLIACMKCGLCQAVCPVFGSTMLEADVTRGKIALLENLAHRMIADPQAVNEKLGRCLLCGSCQANCPSGVSIMEIFMKSRQIVTAYLGLSLPKRFIFRTMLARPKLFNTLVRLGLPFKSLVLCKRHNVQNTACAPLLSRFIGKRQISNLPCKPLHAEGALDTSVGASGIKVAFFPGCLGDKLYTEMSKACLKVFAYHGVGVFMPTAFACCGIPALASGDKPGAVKQAMINLEILKNVKFDYLVTPCASCTATIKEWWPELGNAMEPQYRSQTQELAQKTMDVNAFLIDVLKIEPGANQGKARRKVTYHDPCHLKKSLGISSQPRAVVKMNPTYELVEMPEADRCCGCGGSFNLFHYDISKDIGQRKRNNVLSSGAHLVATSCPACMMQLTDMLAQNRDQITVKHTVELYAETLP